MADKKISELPATSALDTDDLLAVVEDGTTVKATVGDLFGFDQVVDGIHSVPAIIVKESPTDVRHPDFGGIDQTGSTDATATIQEAIDYITGPADPEFNTRSASSPLYIPAGNYKITEPIRVTGVVGFHMYGDGKEQTNFQPTGTMDRVLDLNGVSRSSFGKFSIDGNGTESIGDAAIHCRRNTTARTTNYSTLYSIALTSTTRCVYGIHIGEPGNNTQNDTWKMDDLEILGAFTPGETTWWQSGIHLGTGAFNNNLDHKGYDLNVSTWRRCFVIDANQFALFGFESGNAEADFYLTEYTSYLSVIGGRTEGSDRLIYQSTTGGSPALATFSDIDFKANGLHTDGKAVSWRYGGSLSLKNVRFYGSPLPGDTPRLETITSGNELDVTLDGVASLATLEEFLTDVDSTTQVHIRNGYVEIDPDGSQAVHTYGSVDISGGAATDVIARNRLNDDDYDRWQMTVGGSTYIGDGTAAPTAAAVGQPTMLFTAAQTPKAQTGLNAPTINTGYWFGVKADLSNAQNNYFEFYAALPAGTYTVDVFHRTTTNAGRYHILFSGASATSLGGSADYVDGYDGGFNITKSSITGVVIPTSKLYTVRFITATKHASSSGYASDHSAVALVKTA